MYNFFFKYLISVAYLLEKSLLLSPVIILIMKILVVRFSSIGDIVLTSPVLRCLKTQSEHVVHFVTKRKFESVVAANPYIDKTIFLEDDLMALVKVLKSENYDYIVDLHHNLRSKIIKIMLNKPSSTFHKLNFQKLLLTKFKVDRLPRIHIVDRYMETLRELGVKNDGLGLDFFIDREEGLPQDVQLPDNYYVFAIGGQHKTKIVPHDIVVRIINRVSSSENVDFVIIGGKENREDGDFIASKTGAINLSGVLSINQSAQVMEKSKVVYTGDTGMMHIAAALKKNVVSFWGNTVPEFGMYPYFPTGFQGKNVIVENKNLSCRPCHKLGYKECPKKHFECMRWLENEY